MIYTFVQEIPVHYLWGGFVKKFKSLNSAGVVPQRVEAFCIHGRANKLAKLWHYKRSLVQVNSVLDYGKPRGTFCFSRGSFSLFSFKLLYSCCFSFSFFS